jgi:quinol monooxygenase YgiN
MSLFLTAVSKSKPGSSQELKALLLELVKNSRQEAACIQYDLHQSTDDENMFIFHEEWQSEEGFKLHNTQPHILKHKEASKDIIDGPTILHITKRLA